MFGSIDYQQYKAYWDLVITNAHTAKSLKILYCIYNYLIL